ncbi:PREDICTED: amyloid protein-binding protein 2-like isoform X3 [Priapulus caudatus]|uniref:Amyloid protein-binding protein 2-like isoform X1 n=1 Tax=Priapulus caudatus TaxID=37621 RepID=A0ABM1DVQ7_PRICU|nr:PREDICTED: amyloid protein-binding protein 2-like isoform X1 [Priapulus caudatus]XP_014664028.1 PREDICTED: amyloid protein-binding protein 2-like isoform X2 [Priapulus caudatus]XP_014664030.1 PREDICTED: amyloid protein-binding protein 2-like isoform X3 [Priapulus caudatus]
MASALNWIPDSLYNTTINVVVTHYTRTRRELKTFPENVQFDVYYKLYKQGPLCLLGMEFCELDVFSKVLKVSDKRHLLHHCFQALMDQGIRIADILADSYSQNCCVVHASVQTVKDRTIQLGFALEAFLSEAGWYCASERVMSACFQLCKLENNTTNWTKCLECCIRLLHSRNLYCKFTESDTSYHESQYYAEKLISAGHPINTSSLYCELCSLFFVRSQYDEAYKWSTLALKGLTSALPSKVIVDVLRQASKACVVKREFRRAEMLITEAVHVARDAFGCQHPKYADTLLDYSFYLLNVDQISQSVQVYQTALDVRQSVFGGKNIHVAIAHEDLAYALYVHEYSSGRFSDAREHAEKAIQIMSQILPEDHLLMASSKRVKALILEEIAIDSHLKEKEERLLQEALDLHLVALSLAKKAFGEENVQTAKHYGNLGRLYQSMHQYKEAQGMHLKAIEIKEKLLGTEDYEVALSVGHLASLYNYDMLLHSDAEQLYLRSISIGKKLFGEAYSGLEYDYRGLLRLYSTTGRFEKAEEYSYVLHQWNQLRDRSTENEVRLDDMKRVCPTVEAVVHTFFSMSS